MFFSKHSEQTTREKAIKILQTISKSDGLPNELSVKELNEYMTALNNLQDEYKFCKDYIAYAILETMKKSGKEESVELYNEVNTIAKRIIELYNTQNPDKQQFNSVVEICYTEPLLGFDC